MTRLYRSDADHANEAARSFCTTAQYANGNTDRNRFGNDVGLAHDLPYQCRDPIWALLKSSARAALRSGFHNNAKIRIMTRINCFVAMEGASPKEFSKRCASHVGGARPRG
ncbi:MAG: hypothetical protein WAK55_33960 [Xanthobacteraceae bacterium]